MANTAPTSGTAAARMPRNTKNSNNNKNGRAKSSARPRSCDETACDLDAGHGGAAEPGIALQRRLGRDGLLRGR